MSDTAATVIFGAGLSGLALAHALQAQGRSVTVLEARARPGGRVLSQDGYDMGPAWIWPHNHRMLALVDQLGLTLFEQYASGRLIFEDAQGTIRRDLEMATMGGALRVAGGLAQITDALARRVGASLRLNHPVTRITPEPSAVLVEGTDFSLRAQQVVLALPPRLAAGLGVPVPDVPTWMAGHAKLVAVYDRPFWRQEGFNGDAVSHRGPLAEIHDASPVDGAQGALFGFAVPGAARHAGFEQAALDQLARLFGPQAGAPLSVYVQDWSTDPATATPADADPPRSHPHYAAVPPTGRILFAGTETAGTEGGFLEGALAAAETALSALQQRAA